MENFWFSFSVTAPLVFLAGFVDSIAGGGGIISIPAYLFAGIPIHIAYGTNKFSSCVGTLIAAGNYAKNKYVHWKSALCAAFFAAIGSLCGTKLTLAISPEVLQVILLFLLPTIALFILLNRTFTIPQHERHFETWFVLLLSAVIGLILGCYDGFFGPGTGMFLVIAFTVFLKYDLVTASGTAKIINLASNTASFIVYIISGKVWFLLGFCCACFSIAGNLLGSHLAIKIGTKFIRVIIIVTVLILFAKIIFDYLGSL